jgi:transcriptional regulator, XRE family
MIKNNIPVQMAEKRMNIQKVSDLTGISRTTLSKIVNDKFTRIDLDTINQLCKVLECTTQDLLEYIPD